MKQTCTWACLLDVISGGWSEVDRDAAPIMPGGRRFALAYATIGALIETAWPPGGRIR